MHAHRTLRYGVAVALVAGLATTSLSVMSTQAAGASTATVASTLRQIATNVNDCLHGGYVKYSTTSGKRFNDELGCVIYVPTFSSSHQPLHSVRDMSRYLPQYIAGSATPSAVPERHEDPTGRSPEIST